MKTFAEIKEELQKPIPPQLIKHREQGGRDIAYVNVTDYKDLLDERAERWTAEIRDCRQIGESLCTVVRLTIHASDGDFFQDGSGMEPLDGNGYGDPFSNAYAQSLRRACETHGLSRELWHKDETPDYSARNGYAQPESNSDPVAHSLNDLVTAKQLGMIRAIARELGLEPDEECQEVLNCKTDELSKKAASSLIKHLQDEQRNRDIKNGQPVPFRRAV
jgi:hypothetical protein